MLKMTAKLKPPSHKRSLICPRSVTGASDFPPSRPCSSLSSTAGAKLSAVPWRTFPTAVHSYIAIRYCDRSTAVGSQVEVLLEFPPQARGNSILVWCTGKVLRVERELKDGKFGIAVGFEQLQVLPRA